MIRPIAGLALLLLGCGGSGSGSDGPLTNPDDADRDGYPVPVDCDDNDASVRPGGNDIWYDGIDSDCVGDDDFDQDADGFPVDTDCNDVNADVSPGEEEVPYDGLDNDCDESTPDSDLDADGFVIPEDCDDEDAAVFPGAAERLGDATDGDCDGGVDSTSFSYSDLLWEEVRPPRVVANDRHILLATTAASMQDGYDDPLALLGVAMWFDLLASGTNIEPLDAPIVWIGSTTDDDYHDIDLEPDSDGFVVGAAYYSSVSLFGWALVQELDWVEAIGGYLVGPAYFRGEPAFDHEHADLMIDGAGVGWTVVCDDDTLSYVQGTGGFPNPGGGLVATVDGSAGCFFEDTATPPIATACAEGGGCVTFDLDPDLPDPTPRLSASQPWASETWSSVRDQSGVITALEEGGGVTVIDGPDRWDLLSGQTVIDALAVFDGTGQLYMGAVVDDGTGYIREVVLVYGDPASPTEVALPMEDPTRTLLPEGVAITVTDDRVVLAVAADELAGTGGQDGLGWIFWEK